MDFLDPHKKRVHRIRLMVGYGLIAVALLISTLVLVYATSGYGIDRKTGEIIQNGLVFVDAHPQSATIFINGENRGTTDGRFVLEEGKYTVRLQRDGYRTWQQSFNLDGGSIERLVYPFLFPTTLTSVDTHVNANTLDLASQSPDRRWVVMHETRSQSLTITDTSTETNATTTITLPTSVYTPREAGDRLEAVEWSTDNRHLLLRHSYDGGSEFIMLDRQTPAESKNINTTLGRAYTQISLRDKRADQLYVYDAGSGLLQTADLNSKALDVVANKVLGFWPHGSDTLVYVTNNEAPADKVFVRITQSGSTYTLRTLPVSPTYLLNIAQFNGHMYVAAGTSAESRVYLYDNPLNALKRKTSQPITVKALLKVDASAEFVSFSANARFVAVQGGGKFALYDAENNRQFRYDTGLNLPAGLKATWMDGHRLTVTSDGKLRVFDFDGTNMQTLLDTDASFVPFFDRDYTALSTVSPSLSQPGKTALVRTDLVVEK